VELNNVLHNLKNLEAGRAALSLIDGKHAVIVQVTTKCNAKCRVCRFHPEKHDTINFEKFKTWLTQKRKQGEVLSVCINGGEPTLEHSLCRKIRALCRELGILCSLITNAWWGKNPETRMLIKNLDLFQITLSRDIYHLEYVDDKTFDASVDFIKTLNIPFPRIFCMVDVDNLYNERQITQEYFNRLQKKYKGFEVVQIPIKAKVSCDSCTGAFSDFEYCEPRLIYLAKNEEGTECCSGYVNKKDCPKKI